jgi:leader peptidase (prepilin peptidase)/N-methyltransferase
MLFAMISIPLIYFFPPIYIEWVLAMIIFTYLGLVFIIDFEHRLILHPVSFVGGVIFLIMGIFLNGWKITIFGFLAGFGIMYALYLLGILFGKFMAKRRGQEIDEIALGFGDVTLSTILGLLLGWPRIGVTLFFAIILGGVFSGFFLFFSVITRRYKAFTAIPYAPFIIISGIILIYLSSGS